MSGRPGLFPWIGGWLAVVAVQLGSPLLPGAQRSYGSASGLFWVVVVAASLCVAASVVMLVTAFRDEVAELAIAGAFFHAVSILPLVHGLTVPGVVYGPNVATMTAVLWALPVASLSAAPLWLPGRAAAALRSAWRTWVLGCLGVQVMLALGLLIRPSLLPFVGMGEPLAVILGIAALGPCLVLSARHVRLYWIGRAPGSLGVSMGFACVAAANLVWLGGEPMNLAFWIAHAIDIVGVLVGTVLAIATYRVSDVRRAILRPFVARDALDALELGLEPTVRRFVADLERKDPITRDHVVRVSETAIAVGERLDLPAPELRLLGIGALLHDVGKLEIDDAVLNKPGKLTDDEYAHIRSHAVIGAMMLVSSPELRRASPIVRHHHERIDGRGYPDGLRGSEIPVSARIVSVCDSFDAMAHTRQYRDGMGYDKAVAVLREHSGAQWDEQIVEVLVTLVGEGRVAAAPTVLADVGRESACACGDLVALVDA